MRRIASPMQSAGGCQTPVTLFRPHPSMPPPANAHRVQCPADATTQKVLPIGLPEKASGKTFGVATQCWTWFGQINSRGTGRRLPWTGVSDKPTAVLASILWTLAAKKATSPPSLTHADVDGSFTLLANPCRTSITHLSRMGSASCIDARKRCLLPRLWPQSIGSGSRL